MQLILKQREDRYLTIKIVSWEIISNMKNKKHRTGEGEGGMGVEESLHC